MAEVDGVKLASAKTSQMQLNISSPSPPANVQTRKSDRADALVDLMEDSGAIAKSEPPKLSKNQQKKLKRKQDWEDGRDARKARRKEKNKERKARKRAAKRDGEEEAERISRHGCDQTSTSSLVNPDSSVDRALSNDVNVPAIKQSTSNEPENDSSRKTIYSNWKEQKKRHRSAQLPLTFIYDCAFDDLMNDSELISLASQLTRAYSDNRKAKYRAHMMISSFGGKLKERFEGILDRHHEHWKGVTFTEGDFVQASELAQQGMQASGSWPGAYQAEAGELPGFKYVSDPGPSATSNSPSNSAKKLVQRDIFCEGADEQAEVVYLTSDSPHSLEYLRPYSTYIIGGLVDKNRHKGVCYKRACDRDVKTAKLPIGEYMRMSSRQVLATNHVGEIMLKWLECGGDWGRAFDGVIPKRKGGVLKELADEEDKDVMGDQADPQMEEESENAVCQGPNASGDKKQPDA